MDALLTKSNFSAADITAIGSHGQTVRHQPVSPHAFTLQIGDPNTIALKTNITTVADFRRRDIANGGQGAPFAPAFHDAFFRTDLEDRAIINIGGIANISILPADKNKPVVGFDTGPGNGLMDAWAQKHICTAYDNNGEWAASGVVNDALLEKLMSDPYFKLPSPKSTGKEYFNLSWLDSFLSDDLKPEDVQATLLELTARTISKATPDNKQVVLCGGGVNNSALVNALVTRHPKLKTTEYLGIAPQWVEAAGFAWLAKQTIEKNPVNLTHITGAKQPTILGGTYLF